MSPLFWAKVLIISPLIGMISVICALYGTAYEDAWLNKMYDHDISDLGTTWSKYHIIFAIGFTITSIIIIMGALIKIRLMAILWKIACKLITNMFFLSVGAVMLIIMAWTPYNVNWLVHATGAAFGIFITLLAQILDTIYWYKYIKFKKCFNSSFYILTLYSLICLICSLTFFILWMHSEYVSYGSNNHTKRHKPLYEWIGLLCAILGFLPQSAHGLRIYQHLFIRQNKNKLLINSKRNVSKSNRT
eukprot:475921_1